LKEKLSRIDVVFVSHLQIGHRDEAAINLTDKTTPIVCQENIADTIASYGFQNIHEVNQQIEIDDVKLHLISGQYALEILCLTHALIGISGIYAHVLRWICNQRWRDADRVKWIYVYYLIPIVSIIYLKSENAPLDNQLSCLKE